MMGQQTRSGSLFYYFRLEDQIPEDHGLFEIPASYGTNVRFFRRISYDEALEYLRRFAKEKGMLLLD